MFNRVAIIGLGLIGGSFGLALRKAKGAREITGSDLGKGISDRARKIGAIDQPYVALADAIRGAGFDCAGNASGRDARTASDIWKGVRERGCGG